MLALEFYYTINSVGPGVRILLWDFEFFRKKKKKDPLLRARSVGRHNSTHVDEGRKSGKLLTIQMRGTNRRWVGGEKSLQCDPGSELRL